MDLVVSQNALFQGQITPPADKSISHRAAIISALSQGESLIKNFLTSSDCMATLSAMRALGVAIEQVDEHHFLVKGKGLHALTAPKAAIDCGNAGTGMRLLAGVLAAQPFYSELHGDASLSRRPMERIVTPLLQMGASMTGVKRGERICAPLSIHGKPLSGISYELPVESAQIKSCLLFAGLYAKGQTTIIEKGECRDHTERMLAAFGCDINLSLGRITLKPGNTLKAQTLTIPGDFSSAAFFIGAASMQKGAHLIVKDVGVNERRLGFLHILKKMGAEITLQNPRMINHEPIADLEIKGAQLEGIDVPLRWVVSAMDEFPILFIVAANALGETKISGVSELRVKESDRLAVMCQGLKALGISVQEQTDGVSIIGGKLSGGSVDSAFDHRVSMAFAMAAACAQGEIHIKNCENINTSFPNFCELATSMGLAIKIIKE